MDSHFEDILNSSKLAFNVKTIINIIVVVLGIVFILNSIYYAWTKNVTDWWESFLVAVLAWRVWSLFSSINPKIT